MGALQERASRARKEASRRSAQAQTTRQRNQRGASLTKARSVLAKVCGVEEDELSGLRPLPARVEGDPTQPVYGYKKDGLEFVAIPRGDAYGVWVRLKGEEVAVNSLSHLGALLEESR